MNDSKSPFIEETELKLIDIWINRLRKEDTYYKDRKSVVKSELRLPYPIIGWGARRVCFDIGKGFVLKVAIGRKGILQCTDEWNFYHTVSPDMKKLFCKAIAAGDGWIIMEKIEDQIPCTEKYDKKIKGIGKYLEKHGIKPYDLINRNARLNKKGEIVIVDYSGYQQLSSGPNEERLGTG